MSRLVASLRPTDHQRVKRLLIAWHDGDRLAADTVLAEVAADPIGTPALVFGLATYTVELATRLGVDTQLVAGLRDDLLDDATDTSDTGQDSQDDAGPDDAA